jgi:hypothetical protein
MAKARTRCSRRSGGTKSSLCPRICVPTGGWMATDVSRGCAMLPARIAGPTQDAGVR